ncbi:AFR658Wp [Eremothecium gossypii ATCC 10895]|uniref:Protein YIF1 n=1 Tax=Eremothecium gossypii (strain ATCC 10895 / CBS 109.51 / FGSC 9923 / NRRL Y-1056) TaxID=284811 RepID=Q752B7_EREGS|nr:AFR658Wp [Eremothecium gossypii ATCC 10895]AAS54030.1 AFR658Wp [Eremothecium gossypii ATCC 10895]AEY98345.1 FAFR658Wp [Eremothecium gossypii FDAG1]
MTYNPYYEQSQAAQARYPQGQRQMQQTPADPRYQQQYGQTAPQGPAYAGFADPRASMAFQFGQSALNQFIGSENFNQFQETVQRATGGGDLSHYFQVSNSYVFQKLKVMLLPMLHKQWQRIPDTNNSFQPPRSDINSPDMYVPLMGLVTYILAWNLEQGLHGSFDPENLYFKLSSTLAYLVLDLAILKLGLYLLVPINSKTTSLVELACYVGYKFVPLIFAMLLPRQPVWATVLGKFYLFMAFGIFLLRSVKFNLFNDTANDVNTVKKSVVKKCNYFLFFYGVVLQSGLMWLMG